MTVYIELLMLLLLLLLLLCHQMTEVELEIVFSGLGHEVQDVRIVQDMRTGASKGYVSKGACHKMNRVERKKKIAGWPITIRISGTIQVIFKYF